ncbi:MAG TPA: NotI family restriction endonuclease [Pyrinomonadaceae bacterium]
MASNKKPADTIFADVAEPAEPKNPLAEVFGFPTNNKSERALHYQSNRLCPFHNVVPNCTKVSVVDPLGVCSLLDKDGNPTVVCPVRFKEDYLITAEAARFFFPPATKWEALPEIRLKDAHGKAAGNVDMILVAHDEKGTVTDFGALEIQSVYISGNVRRPFVEFTTDLSAKTIDWTGKREYPRPDYLSSSRKRLAPQLIYKGGILRTWEKKIAVVTDRKFFDTLPKLVEVAAADADIAWLVYDLIRDSTDDVFKLTHHKTTYTRFAPALDTITRTEAGPVEDFIRVLQTKLRKLNKGEMVADTTLASEALE